jgi:hypothetical protein
MTLAFHPLAARELEDAAAFYDGAARGLGIEFLEEMERMTETLQTYPDAGAAVDAEMRILAARRFPYTLVYRVRDREVLILAVAHHRRHPLYWAGRSE